MHENYRKIWISEFILVCRIIYMRRLDFDQTLQFVIVQSEIVQIQKKKEKEIKNHCWQANKQAASAKEWNLCGVTYHDKASPMRIVSNKKANEKHQISYRTETERKLTHNMWCGGSTNVFCFFFLVLLFAYYVVYRVYRKEKR